MESPPSRSNGGVILPPGVDPEDLDTIVLQPQTHALVYFCPMCGSRTRSNLAGMEPVCTGPHPSLDEHEMTPMMRAHDT